MPGLSKREKRSHKKSLLPPPPVAKKPERPKVKRFLWMAPLLQRLHWAVLLPLTSYTAILLLQLRVVWGMWWFKDITGGDTTQYFLEAARWFETGRNSVLWSPMYTAFYGTLLHLSPDPYFVTVLHRLIIVFLSAVLVLAIMRRLLPPGIAWMAAAWWVVLPINYDALYEVHMFTVIPLSFAILAALWIPGDWGKGLTAAILLLTGTLMRNEYLVAAALFTVLSLGWTLLHAPRESAAYKKVAIAYGLPLLAVSILSVVFFFRSSPAFNASSARGKQTLNVCQVFAAGYQQRASDFQGSPWTECDQLMNRYFGSADLTFTQAFARNPRAFLEHVLWNIELTPSGLQVLLFNLRSGSANPDYVPTAQTDIVLIPSLLACVTLLAGLILLVRERTQWRVEWTEQRTWGWIAMACACISVCAAMLSNRPRPSYMFILGITLRAVTAYCFYVIVSRFPRLRRVSVGVSVLLVAIVLLKPSVFMAKPSTRPALTAIRRILPAASAFAEPHPLLVSTNLGVEITTYIGHCNCPAMRFDQLRDEITPEVPLAQVLDRKGANLFYVDEIIMSDPRASQFVKDAANYHWQLVAGRHSGQENWAVLRKAP